MTPSNLKEEKQISRWAGVRKQGGVLRIHIGIVMDLEGFTLMFKSMASFAMS